MNEPTYELQAGGLGVESPLTDRDAAPKQGDEGAPPARVVFRPEFGEAAADLRIGDEVIVLTWLHQAVVTCCRCIRARPRTWYRQGVFLHLVTGSP